MAVCCSVESSRSGLMRMSVVKGSSTRTNSTTTLLALVVVVYLIICHISDVSGFQPSTRFLKQQHQQQHLVLPEQLATTRNIVSYHHGGGWRSDLSTRRWAAAETTTEKEKTTKDTTKVVDQSGEETTSASAPPQVMSSGYSEAIDMTTAIQEAVAMALDGLPTPSAEAKSSKIDLAIISISSLYDGSGAGSSSTTSAVVPALLDAAKGYGSGIQHVIGSSSGGVIGSSRVGTGTAGDHSSSSSDTTQKDEEDGGGKDTPASCQPVEREGVPCVSITLCILPDVNVDTFHVSSDEVPENWSRLESHQWRDSVGMMTTKRQNEEEEKDDDGIAAVFLLPSPAFSKELDDLLGGMEMHLTASTTTTASAKPTVFGAVASTVSSLSRARLFRYDCHEPDGVQALADGCVGLLFSGDIEIQTVTAQGAKPVGGVYQIVKGQESTIYTVALDETATELIQQAEEEDRDDNDDTRDGDEDDDMDVNAGDRKSQMAAAYAKARIPKPVLAEANFLMRTLSDDDQAFMQKTLLVGLERSGALGRTHSELSRLAEGKGHAFEVHPVASAAQKDGSVTLSLGSVNVEPGSKMRFFVRESRYAKREVEAIWTGFKAQNSAASTQDDDMDDPSKALFQPTGCFVFPTLDRGNKFFLGKPGFESSTISKFLPSVPSISGFFSNGVISSLSTPEEKKIGMNFSPELVGSATIYVLFGSKSDRPIFTGRLSENAKSSSADDDATSEEDEVTSQSNVSFDTTTKKAPRDEDGELILKRREVHSGRALTVSTVEWSVAEKTATPSSTLEGFMWDKETEVDRFRERVPLANLLSQCKLYTLDPSKPKPRSWVGPIVKAAGLGQDGEQRRFVIVPECKRIEPEMGSLRKRYDAAKLSVEFATQGAPSISINCDAVMFGGSLDDVTKAREAASTMALEAGTVDDSDSGDASPAAAGPPPILASDLLLYPYQLYKIRLAGADAVNLVVGALASKDLVYLTKIASSLQMQSLLSVTSIAQLEKVMALSPNSFDGLIVSNRELEDFSFDMTGNQALEILQSPAMKSLREKHGDEFPVLVEGRVGIIGCDDDSTDDSALSYIRKLEDAGATGAIVGGGLAVNDDLLLRFNKD